MAGEPTTEDDTASDRRGGVVEPYQPEEILAVFAARADPSEPLTSREISEANGRSQSATLKHAKKLAARGHLRTKKTGPLSRVFWLPSDASPRAGDTHD